MTCIFERPLVPSGKSIDHPWCLRVRFHLETFRTCINKIRLHKYCLLLLTFAVINIICWSSAGETDCGCLFEFGKCYFILLHVELYILFLWIYAKNYSHCLEDWVFIRYSILIVSHKCLSHLIWYFFFINSFDHWFVAEDHPLYNLNTVIWYIIRYKIMSVLLLAAWAGQIRW